MDIWDWQRFRPMTPMTVPGAPTPVPTFTTAVPPVPPAPSAPVPPSGRPPSITLFGGMPMGPHTGREIITPPTQAATGAKGTSPIPLVGPGAASPAITGAPITPQGIGTAFGNPVTREAASVTPAGKTWQEELMAKVKNGDFDGALAQIAGGGGGGGKIEGSAPPEHRLRPAPQPHMPEGKAEGELNKLLERSANRAKLPKRRKTQDRYDLENWRQ